MRAPASAQPQFSTEQEVCSDRCFENPAVVARSCSFEAYIPDSTICLGLGSLTHSNRAQPMLLEEAAASRRSRQRACMSKSALLRDLHCGQESVISTVRLFWAPVHTPAGLSSLQVICQQVLGHQQPGILSMCKTLWIQLQEVLAGGMLCDAA